MEYVFGTIGEREILKTKGSSHSNLTGYQSSFQEYPDQTIADHFRIVRKLESKEDVDGSCYDWYEIDRHYQTIDKTGQLKTDILNAQLALCDVYEMYEQLLGETED